ncbi:MAG TPA: DUF1015 domain-containing protein, partial [Phycisphaerales bacterium]|nr:DUF1015 domain-containing protein [Phycisphaerales bacterium]
MEVRPFKAFRFNETVVGEVGGCIAPPYDVIDPAQQARLYEKSEYNIVRIIKGRETSSDNDSNNQYTRAADYLNTWIKKGILKQDLAETIYAYVQNFQRAGTQFQRSSFIALAKLEEFGKTVRGHEETLNSPKIDRLNLTRATAAQFGLVFCLYEDEQKIAEKIIEATAAQDALVDFVDEQGVRHRLFAITAKNDIAAIVKMTTDKSCIIADGHHRYETALAYYKETASPKAAYQMIAFANTHQDGLVILATHRLVGNLEKFDIRKLLAGLKENFEVTEMESKQKMLAQMKAEQALDKNAFGIYSGRNAYYVAVLENKQAMDSAAAEKSSPWKSLDVSVLHKLILEELLGIDERKLAAGSNVEYIKDTDNAIDESIARVDERCKQAAF